MPSRPYPTSLADLQRLNHYQALGLTEGASSEDIDKSLRKERWPWHLVEEEARQFATRRRIEAYGLLVDPRERLAFDIESGYTKQHLARAIGSDDSIWANSWIVAFVIAALLLLLGGGSATARALGSGFAPDFEEVAVYHEPECGFPPCEGYYSREFRSSSDVWEWFLGRDLFLWLAPPLLIVGLGMVTRTAAARTCGYAVASVRYMSHRDTLIRAIVLLCMMTVPVFVFLYMWLVPPDAIPLPSG